MGSQTWTTPLVPTLVDLERAIKSSWGVDTVHGSAAIKAVEDPSWMDDMFERNPAWNQCIVTSLVVQDFYGGMIVKADTRPHWWNVTPEGVHIDFTADQFDEDDRDYVAGEIWSRHKILNGYKDSVRERYLTLRDRVLENL